MNIKIKGDKIINGLENLKKLSNIDLPISLALKVKRNIDECQKVLVLIEQKRLELVEPLDLESEEAVPEEIIKQLEDYLQEEIEIPIEKLSLKRMEELGVKLSGSDIANIEWMYEFDA